jgi:MFS transporter, DHA1 family, multidrug resistance protein
MFKAAWLHLVDDYKHIPLGIKLLVFVIFVRALGWGFVDPFFSLYLDRFTSNYALIGLLTSVVAFTSLLTIIPLMRLSDKVQERIVIQDGETLYLIVVLSYVLAGMTRNFPLLIFGLALNGIAQTLVVVGVEAYIRKHDGHGRVGPFAFYISMDFLGWILGMLLAAFTVQYYNLNSMFLFILPSILMGFAILPRIHEQGLKSIFAGLRRYLHSRQDFIDLFHDFKSLNPKTFFFLVLAFFDGVIRMFTYIFIPLFAVQLKLGLPAVALLSVVMYLPFVFTFFFSEISDLMNRMKVIASALFVGGAAFVLLHFVVHQWWVIGLCALTSLSFSILRPAFNGALTRLTPRSKLGEITGIYNFVDRVGRIVGPVFLGLVADQLGLKFTFLLIALIAFGLGLLSLALRGQDIPDAYQVEDVL